MTRLELVTEAVRAVLEDVARAAPELLDELVTVEWAERYGGRCACAPRPATPSPDWSRWVPTPANCFRVLRTILVQYFLMDRRGRFRPRTERDGQPPSRVQIESPY
ncbi:hypothetical protein [Streptomyces sp. T028]|uniref:hypothetical protein n=1 Tax=Streptomyces sp. T028 TaxID=3394379 RepID=UPI003A89ADE5